MPNIVISPNFLVWKFCGKAQFSHSIGRINKEFNDGNIFFAEGANCYSIDSEEVWSLPRPLEIQNHVQKPIMSKVVVWRGLDTRFELHEQTENLMG